MRLLLKSKVWYYTQLGCEFTHPHINPLRLLQCQQLYWFWTWNRKVICDFLSLSMGVIISSSLSRVQGRIHQVMDNIVVQAIIEDDFNPRQWHRSLFSWEEGAKLRNLLVKPILIIVMIQKILRWLLNSIIDDRWFMTKHFFRKLFHDIHTHTTVIVSL